jgi:hypothetical protein
MARRASHLKVVDTSDDNPAADRPVVNIKNGKRTEAIDEAEPYLVQLGSLYERGDLIVRVAPQEIETVDGGKAEALRVVPVENEHLRECFSQAVELRKYDKRADAWKPIDCPHDFAAAYLERTGMRRLLPLAAVATCPVLRRDGSIVTRPGYDPASEIYYDPRGVEFPPVPKTPTRADALAALEQLDALLASFDFVDDASRSVALSAILTALFRRAMSAAPMHGFTAPVAGSGKSKLVNIPATLLTGHHAPVTAVGMRDEETEKRLGSVLLAGDPIIALDNAERPIGGEFLCQAITEPLIAFRILGTSSRLTVSNTACWFATGNNLKFAGDMVRRALLCRLDPQCERPELREFETPDPCLTALAERPQFVTAALTIARAFIVAGCPRDVAPVGSFPDWSKWVRDPLIWLGRADPVEGLGEARRDDPVLAALTAIVEQWNLALHNDRVSASQIVGAAGSHADFREALMSVAGERGEISTRRFGQYLGKVKGRTVNGRRIIPAETLHGVARWQLEGADPRGGKGG